jgi:hypothetical protein
LGQFCDVAKWQSTAGRFSQIWLKEKYESKIFLTTSFHISGYLLVQIFFLIMAIENLGQKNLL